jgi:hypothetical protein
VRSLATLAGVCVCVCVCVADNGSQMTAGWPDAVCVSGVCVCVCVCVWEQLWSQKDGVGWRSSLCVQSIFVHWQVCVCVCVCVLCVCVWEQRVTQKATAGSLCCQLTHWQVVCVCVRRIVCKEQTGRSGSWLACSCACRCLLFVLYMCVCCVCVFVCGVVCATGLR